MDLINNLVFTSLNAVVGPGGPYNPLRQNFFPMSPLLPVAAAPLNRGAFFSYNTNVIEEFCSVDDPELIENAVQKHWADMVTGRNYIDSGANLVNNFLDLAGSLIPPYHMIYAYLVENTRIAQIFEKLVHMYMHDEKLRKITPITNTNQNRAAFQWIANTENLFFKSLANNSYRNIVSQVRSSADASRRNAYFRLLGMDLAFGDGISNAAVNFHKAESNNQPFIVIFEKFLSEIWQAYTNARNAIGPNTTDMFVIIDTAQKIQEMLMSRRTTETTFTNYRYFNLSKEEYSSVVMMSWLYEVVSYDSPIVQFLRCNGNTPGERLINIGDKVGLPAHSKSEGLLDIAPPMNTLLRRVELGDYNIENTVSTIITSQANNLPATNPNRQALNELLSIINNWEKATGHRIKNPEANITARVRVQPQQANGANANGVSSNGVGLKPQQAMN